MLGSDPISALLGAGLDPRSPKNSYSRYLTEVVKKGSAVVMLGADVIVPDDADDELRTALATMMADIPPGAQMPASRIKALKDAGQVDVDVARMRSRVTSYWGTLARYLGKDRVEELISSGVVNPMMGLHVGMTGAVAVTVPDAAAFAQWRTWSAEVSGDPYEAHSAPTLLLPTAPGGGVYLFRIPDGVIVPAEVTLEFAGCTVQTGDVIVPIPPSRFHGKLVTRLGPARPLPEWLHAQITPAAVSEDIAV